MISAHAVLATACFQAPDAGPTQAPPLPPELERALAEFGLIPAFRARPAAQQRHQIRWVTAGSTDAVRQNRIASVLDQLAIGAPAYGLASARPVSGKQVAGVRREEGA